MVDNSGQMASGGLVSVETTNDKGQSLTIQSNSSTKEQMEASLNPEKEDSKDEKPKTVSDAASELGRKGGEASAKARAAVKRAEAKKAAAEKETPEAEPTKEAKGEEDADAPDSNKAGDSRKADSKGDSEGGSTEDLAEADEKPTGKPRHDPRARVAEVTREHSELKRKYAQEQEYRQTLERRLQEVEARTRTPEERKQQESREVDGGEPPPPDYPKIDDFESYEQWHRATIAHEFQVREAKAEAFRQHHAREQAKEAYKHQEREGMKKALVEAFGDPKAAMAQLSEEVLHLKPSILLEDGEEKDGTTWIADDIYSQKDKTKGYLLYFTEHPDEFQRIAALRSPREVTRAMAMLPVDAATTGTSPRAPQVSKAKPPIEPVSGGPHVADAEYKGENQSLDDFASRWNKTQKLKLRR